MDDVKTIVQHLESNVSRVEALMIRHETQFENVTRELHQLALSNTRLAESVKGHTELYQVQIQNQQKDIQECFNVARGSEKKMVSLDKRLTQIEMIVKDYNHIDARVRGLEGAEAKEKIKDAQNEGKVFVVKKVAAWMYGVLALIGVTLINHIDKILAFFMGGNHHAQ